AARATGGKLEPGSVVEVEGQSIERIGAQVSNKIVGDFTLPSGSVIKFYTCVKLTNQDRATLKHSSIVLKSPDSGGYGNQGPTTKHSTKLKGSQVVLNPGATAEIVAETRKGHAHIEYPVNSRMGPQHNGEGVSNNSQTLKRIAVLDKTEGKRHAGDTRFLNGNDEIGNVRVQAGKPGSAETRSRSQTSGLTMTDKTEWSALEDTNSPTLKSQTVKTTHTYRNTSAIAGLVKFGPLNISGFKKLESIKINGKVLAGNLDDPETGIKAAVKSQRGGTAQIEITMPIAGGSDHKPGRASIEVEATGTIKVDPPAPPNP
ncbi:hypothetical protein ACFL6C_08320, partial [Myxococcota bacterium]